MLEVPKERRCEGVKRPKQPQSDFPKKEEIASFHSQ